MNTTLGQTRALLLASRPPTLLASLGPVAVGAFLGHFGPWTTSSLATVFCAAITAVLLQAGANLVNDVRDFERGVDHGGRVGPLRATQAGLLSPKAMRMAYRLVFATAICLASYLAWQGGLLVLVIALASLAAAYCYTAGPFPLSYHGLGEVAAFVFFGPVAVGGSAYLMAHTWSWSAAAWGSGPGLIAAAMMATNNYRDRESDRLAGKATLALRLGPLWARRLPALCLCLAALSLPLYGHYQQHFLWGLVFGALGLLAIWRGIWPLFAGGPTELNLALRLSARFHPAYALCFIYLTVR